MRHAAPVRRDLGIRTVFNLLGPLTNPALVRRQVIGVPSLAAMHLVAGALAGLGCDHALVVHSRDGLDEISLGAATDALEVRGSDVVERVLEPSDFGLGPVSADTLKAASVEESARMVRAILDGGAGPRTDVVVANAAAALYVADLAASLRRARRAPAQRSTAVPRPMSSRAW